MDRFLRVTKGCNWPIEACRDGLQSVNYVASKEVVNV